MKGFLNTKDIPAEQMDLGIKVILELFTKHRLREVFEMARPQVQGGGVTSNASRIFAVREEHLTTVIAFLQGKQRTLARQIVGKK